jgi:hypothetical protein
MSKKKSTGDAPQADVSPPEPPVQAPPASLDHWTATSWDDLASIWKDLFPEPESGHGPTFRGAVVTPSEAGLVFECWVFEAFRLSSEPGRPVDCVRSYHSPPSGPITEQIDGLVFDGWQAFLIESKNWAERIDFEPLAKLQLAVERRPIGTIGLFFSPGGYTSPAQTLLQMIRPIRVLPFDRKDLERALEEHNLRKIVRFKWRQAVQLGDPFLPAVEPSREDILS